MIREGERAGKKKGQGFVLIDCEDGCFCHLILFHLRKIMCKLCAIISHLI